LHRTHKAYSQQYNICDESCQQDSTRGSNVSHLHYDDYYYSFIADLFDDAVNRAHYGEFSNMTVELECLFIVPFQHLPAETEGTMKRTQYLNSGPECQCQMLKCFSWLLKPQTSRVTNVLRATVKAVIVFWGMIPCSLVVLQMLH